MGVLEEARVMVASEAAVRAAWAMVVAMAAAAMAAAMADGKEVSVARVMAGVTVAGTVDVAAAQAAARA